MLRDRARTGRSGSTDRRTDAVVDGVLVAIAVLLVDSICP
jgi:hypothetical protein